MSEKIKAVDIGLAGAILFQPSIFKDPRGLFYKYFDKGALSQAGLKFNLVEEFMSTSKKGVVRGLHYQSGKAAQSRLVWCLKGRIFDVVVDLRKGSETFGKWAGNELSEQNQHMVYVPKGFAHGFISLSDDAWVFYQADAPHSPKDERGIIYNDPELGIKWPPAGSITLSKKDSAWSAFADCEKFE